MAQDKKPDTKRSDIGFIVAIIIGLAVGVLIKKVRIGIILGLIIGTAIVFTGWLRTTNRKN